MLSNTIVDYLVAETIKLNKMRNPELKEKVVKTKSVKLVIISSGLKNTSEYSLDQLAYTIYENFITDEQRDKITLQEFRDEFDRYTECCLLSENFADDIEKMCKGIMQGKMFDKKGEVIKHDENPENDTDENNADNVPEDYDDPFVNDKTDIVESTTVVDDKSNHGGNGEDGTVSELVEPPKKRGRKKKVVIDDEDSDIHE